MREGVTVELCIVRLPDKQRHQNGNCCFQWEQWQMLGTPWWRGRLVSFPWGKLQALQWSYSTHCQLFCWWWVEHHHVGLHGLKRAIVSRCGLHLWFHPLPWPGPPLPLPSPVLPCLLPGGDTCSSIQCWAQHWRWHSNSGRALGGGICSTWTNGTGSDKIWL